MNIFEAASRKKYRFPSIRGELSAEQLWDLPLLAAGITRDIKIDLDTVARSINTELKSVTEESFVAVKPDPRKPDLEAKLEIVKFIIADKIALAEKANARAAREDERRKLIDALAAQEDKELAAKSKEEILKRLAELEAA